LTNPVSDTTEKRQLLKIIKTWRSWGLGGAVKKNFWQQTKNLLNPLNLLTKILRCVVFIVEEQTYARRDLSLSAELPLGRGDGGAPD
jgi:hypothetical protein